MDRQSGMRWITPLLTVAVIIIACDRSSVDANNPPKIQSVAADPETIETGETSELTCQASDDDGDLLEYSWSAEEGSFADGDSGNQVIWQAPQIAGSYTIRVIVGDGEDSDDGFVNVVVTAPVNQPPVAAFTIDPATGTVATVFEVDASGSTDTETPASLLEIRWDWENDGSYDTDWSTDRITTHQYDTAGDYTIRLQVRDADDQTGEITGEVTVSEHVEPLDFVQIPAGSFVMGQSGVAEPEHDVTLTHAFQLGLYEVTNAQFRVALQWAYDNGYVTVDEWYVQAFGVELISFSDSEQHILFSDGAFVTTPINTGDYLGEPSEDHPVVEVTWYGAACFCDWMSMLSDPPLTPFYNGDWSVNANHNPYEATGYRLPTEAEWEYATRYNDDRTYPWGEETPDCDLANMRIGTDQCVGFTAPVGSFPAGNSLPGMRDLAGNVYEWVNDWYGEDYYASSPAADPVGPADGTERGLRGGGYSSTWQWQRAANRHSYTPDSPINYLGFRVCQTTD